MSVKDIPEWNANDLAPTAAKTHHRPAVPDRLRLAVISGVDSGRDLVIGPGSYDVGKHSRCSLVLRDELVSRRHLELRLKDGVVHVKDLGSRNGSFFKGARFSAIEAEPGAVIRVGETELLLMSDETATPMLPSTADAFHTLRGRSLAMRRVFAVLERVAPSNTVVLIEGETGTGKELCAESIHAASDRAKGPFVIADFAAIARNLLEAELFGHVRGAFTGALRDRPGAFEMAHKGTLFLDEIGELELELQPRLLRAIERLQVTRIGETKLRTIDVRIIAATNRDLAEEVKAGRFREDLFHRLSVVRVKLPPLRERKEDLPLLIEALAGEAGAVLLPDTLTLLSEYDWPGNVRELKNVLASAVALAGPGVPLSPAHLQARTTPLPAGLSAIEDFHLAKEEVIANWEQLFLRRLMETNGNNLSRASRVSGVGRAHLYRLLRKHKLIQ